MIMVSFGGKLDTIVSLAFYFNLVESIVCIRKIKEYFFFNNVLTFTKERATKSVKSNLTTTDYR